MDGVGVVCGRFGGVTGLAEEHGPVDGRVTLVGLPAVSGFFA